MRLVARAEAWERIHQSFASINFAAFDYNTIKQSLLDYMKLYFPETFNDYIESSEFIAILELFAYISEQIAYRLDLNAHENFISTAQRRDSILRLAKLVSYSASRPLPARGLVKITSISTTETIIDGNNTNLAGRVIRWNDSNNPLWKEQFMLVINRVLEQEFGTVSPSDRLQIQDVLFEIYGLSTTTLPNGVFSYSATVNGRNIPMELVPVARDANIGIVERRPTTGGNFTILYGSDGLGDGSETTGFFCYTKQGTLQKFRTAFDGVTPNLHYDVSVPNVNQTDVWLNNVDPATGLTLDLTSTSAFRPTWIGKSGEWVQVDLAHAENIIFNTNPNRNKYEVETRDNSNVRIIFGDGEFADVPAGTFDIWVRTSEDEDLLVPQAAVVGAPQSFTYVDSFGTTQTLSFTVSLIGSLQNASAAETIEHIRATAPAVYYSQDRMVNGEDYNVYPLRDPSILRLRAVNRTFAGDSKYITWHDPSTTYENVKMFGDDASLYLQDKEIQSTTPAVSVSTLITGYIEPILSSTYLFIQLTTNGVFSTGINRQFSTVEKTRLTGALTAPPSPISVEMYYDKTLASWHAIKESDDPATAIVGWPDGFILTPLIKIRQVSVSDTRFLITILSRRCVVTSETTEFWNTNLGDRALDYDTLDTNLDKLIILRANPDQNRERILHTNVNLNVLGLDVIDSGPDLGLEDVHSVTTIMTDDNNNGVPDQMNIYSTGTQGLSNVLIPKVVATTVGLIDVPVRYLGGHNDVMITSTIPMVKGTHWIEVVDPNNIGTSIRIISLNGNSSVTILVNEYVYFFRSSMSDPWIHVSRSYGTTVAFAADELAGTKLYTRYIGRDNLHFLWMHHSPRYHLIDPATTNIIDMFVITKGYYIAFKRWLEDNLTLQPAIPTPLQLRSSYGYLLRNKMISDTVVMHPGKFKLLFGPKASPELQAVIKVIRADNGLLTNNQVKTRVTTITRNFFDIASWEFGETFYFTELAAAIQVALATEISSVVLVPTLASSQFGDMLQVHAREDEMFYPDVSVDDIEIVTGFTSTNLRLNP